MKTIIAAVLAGALLAACGGNERDAPPSAPDTKLLSVVVAEAETVAFADTVAHLYLAYFGRPADSVAVTNFSSELSRLGLTKGVAQINEAYGVNPAVHRLVDTFHSSVESQALYGDADNVVFVSAVYANVLGRQPDLNGLVFWTEALKSGGLSRPKAALSIISGAMLNTSPQGLIDGKLVRNRTLFATLFAKAAAAEPLLTSYVGNNAAAYGRSAMAGVTADDTEADIVRKVQGLIDVLRGGVFN